MKTGWWEECVLDRAVLPQALVQIGNHIAVCLSAYKKEKEVTKWKRYVCFRLVVLSIWVADHN